MICKIKLQLIGYLNLLLQAKCFVTCWVESTIISSKSSLLQNIARETSEAEKKRWIKKEFCGIPELKVTSTTKLFFCYKVAFGVWFEFFYLKRKWCFVLRISRCLWFYEIHKSQNLWHHHRHCFIMKVPLMLISLET